MDLVSSVNAKPKNKSLCFIDFDLAFAVETAESQSDDFAVEIQKFVFETVSMLNVSLGRTHVAFVTIGSDAEVAFDLNSIYSADPVLLRSKVSSIKYQGRERNLAAGLKVLSTEVFSPLNGDREHIANVLLLLVTGRETVVNDRTIKYAAALKQKGVRIIVVVLNNQIGEVKLEAIVSSYWEVLYVNNLTDHGSRFDQLTRLLCKENTKETRDQSSVETGWPNKFKGSNEHNRLKRQATGATGPTGPGGAPGPAGPPGPSGSSGAAGAPGSAGPAGPSGPQGAIGATGPSGTPGSTGQTGPSGATGYTGLSGPPGSTGTTGNTGQPGATGAPGVPGSTGDRGATGSSGQPGSTGAAGPPGAPGPAGSSGFPGATGSTGSTGLSGATGPMGSPGATGPFGPPGPPGSSGNTGSTGATGVSGVVGATGATGVGSTGATGGVGATGATGLPGQVSIADKCLTNNGGCQQNCQNTLESYYCTCNRGFQLENSNFTCNGINFSKRRRRRSEESDEYFMNDIFSDGKQHVLSRSKRDINFHTGDYFCGYYPAAGGVSIFCFCKVNATTTVPVNGTQCIDIDECSYDNGGCDQVCNNSQGSYSCSCESGFKMSPSGRSCADIDECKIGISPCPPKSMCVNSYGSYVCI